MTDNGSYLDEEAPLPAPRSNRPQSMSHLVEYALIRGLFALFRLIGVDAASFVSGNFLRIAGPLIAPLSQRARDNLQIVMPELSRSERTRIIAGVWENLGRTVAEFAWLDAFNVNDSRGRVKLVGAERFGAVAESGKPAIFVSGHFANWELMAIALHQSGVKSAVVYRAANNPLIDKMIIEKRARVMSRVQVPKGKRGGRGLIEALKGGRSLAMLVDQKLNDGISVPFLGREAMTATAAARLSLKFGAPVIPASIERLRGAHFRMTVHEPIAYEPKGDLSEDVRALTILINQSIERDIRARPEQWLWLHRRWPTEKQRKKTKKHRRKG